MQKKQPFLQVFFQSLFGLLLFPFILTFSLILMSFAGILSIFQKKKPEEKPREEPWSILVETSQTRLLVKYKGEIRFGSQYFYLKTDPYIKGFEDRTFGDWFYIYKNGVLLQEWNSIKNAETSLIYLDLDKHLLYEIKNSIPSVNWDIGGEKDHPELNCDTGYEILKYRLDALPKF